MSEEFGGALPSQIMRELARLPVGFLEQIIEYRRMAETYRAVERAERPEQIEALQEWPFFTLAWEIHGELAQEEIDEQAHG